MPDFQPHTDFLFQPHTDFRSSLSTENLMDIANNFFIVIVYFDRQCLIADRSDSGTVRFG